VAKFQGDRSRELGERVAKKERKKGKKTSRAFYKSSRTTVTGGLMKIGYYSPVEHAGIDHNDVTVV